MYVYNMYRIRNIKELYVQRDVYIQNNWEKKELKRAGSLRNEPI
jgi:hypothetical protein